MMTLMNGRLFRGGAWALASVAACGCVATWDRSDPVYLPQIAAHAGFLSWGGLTLETTRIQVERKLGRPLAVFADDPPACGTWFSTVDIDGSQAVLQWSDATDHGELESVTFALSEEEVAQTAAGLASLVAARERGVDVHPYSSPSSASLHLQTRPSHVLLIKADREAIAFLSLAECLD